MRYRTIRALAAMLALVALSAPATASNAARAQVAPVDIRGTYLGEGISSLYDCSMSEVDFTTAFSTFVNIPVQDGSFFSGSLGGGTPETAIFSFDAQLATDLSFTGQWSATDPLLNTYLQNRVLTGRFGQDSDAIEMDLTATYDVQELLTCQYRISLSSQGSILTWLAPDPNAAALPPPRALTIDPFQTGGAKVSNLTVIADPRDLPIAKIEKPRDGEPTGYNVYRSTSPNVQTTAQNLFTSVPPTQTSVPVPNGTSGSFFVVTATYDTGESGPSNEVSGGVDAATLTSVKVTAKIKAKGTGFSPTVQVFVDGIPFEKPAKVKTGTRVTQTGKLLTGQTLAQYITSGKTVAISFRNENGGVATTVYTKP